MQKLLMMVNVVYYCSLGNYKIVTEHIFYEMSFINSAQTKLRNILSEVIIIVPSTINMI